MDFFKLSKIRRPVKARFSYRTAEKRQTKQRAHPTAVQTRRLKGSTGTSLVPSPSSTPVTMEAKLSSKRIMSAACLDTSEPAIPMATPMSAFFRAGESFTPSPVTATIAPYQRRRARRPELEERRARPPRLTNPSPGTASAGNPGVTTACCPHSRGLHDVMTS